MFWLTTNGKNLQVVPTLSARIDTGRVDCARCSALLKEAFPGNTRLGGWELSLLVSCYHCQGPHKGRHNTGMKTPPHLTSPTVLSVAPPTVNLECWVSERGGEETEMVIVAAPARRQWRGRSVRRQNISHVRGGTESHQISLHHELFCSLLLTSCLSDTSFLVISICRHSVVLCIL